MTISSQHTTLLRSDIILLRSAFYVSSFLICELNVVCKTSATLRTHFVRQIFVHRRLPSIIIQSKHRASSREYHEGVAPSRYVMLLSNLYDENRKWRSFPRGLFVQVKGINIKSIKFIAKLRIHAL